MKKISMSTNFSSCCIHFLLSSPHFQVLQISYPYISFVIGVQSQLQLSPAEVVKPFDNHTRCTPGFHFHFASNYAGCHNFFNAGGLHMMKNTLKGCSVSAKTIAPLLNIMNQILNNQIHSLLTYIYMIYWNVRASFYLIVLYIFLKKENENYKENKSQQMITITPLILHPFPPQNRGKKMRQQTSVVWLFVSVWR